LDGFEQEIESLNTENEKLITEKEALSKRLIESQEKLKESQKKKESDNEGLYQKITILQNTLDIYSNQSNQAQESVQKLEKLNEDLKLENSDLKARINGLVYELEINYKNQKNHFVVEKNLKDTTEENEKLKKRIVELESIEDFKLKYIQIENYVKELEEKLNISNHQMENLNGENKKLSSENFDKFQKLNSLEGDLKLKSHKIDELEKEKNKLKKSNEEADGKVKNFEYKIKTINTNNENHIKELKKEIDKVVKINEIQKKEIFEYKSQIEVNFIFSINLNITLEF